MNALCSTRLFRHLIASSGPLGLMIGLTVSACVDDPQDDCSGGTYGCECIGGICFSGLTCLSNICVPFSGGETGDGDGDPTGDGDGDPAGDGDGDGDGDPTGDGDGDPTGDGDGDPTGDGDGEPTGDGDGAPAGDPCNGPRVLLFSQNTDTGEGYGLLAGRFTNHNGWSLELADDFTVPAQDQCWCIRDIETRGFYDGAPGATPNVTVEIWNDANGKPGGTSLWSYHGQPTVPAQAQFIVNAPNNTVVPAGKHWLSFRPSLNSTESVWYWSVTTTTTTTGSQAQARDSNQLVVEGCTTWGPASSCYGSIPSPYQFSMKFDIYGVVGGAECN